MTVQNPQISPNSAGFDVPFKSVCFWASALVLITVSMACGKTHKESSKKEVTDQSSRQQNPIGTKPRFQFTKPTSEIKLAFTNSGSLNRFFSFSTQADVSVEQCISGFSRQYTLVVDQVQSVELQSSDKGCVVLLNRISFSNETYLPESNPRPPLFPGQKETFFSENGQRIDVTNKLQLPDNLGQGASAVFQLGILNEGAPIEIIEDILPILSFEEDRVVEESAGTVQVTARLSKPALYDTSVTFEAHNSSTASETEDFTLDSNSIVFKQGETEARFNVDIIDDRLEEKDETLVLELKPNPLFSEFRLQPVFTIQDNDANKESQLLVRYGQSGLGAIRQRMSEWSNESENNFGKMNAIQPVRRKQPRVVRLGDRRSTLKAADFATNTKGFVLQENAALNHPDTRGGRFLSAVLQTGRRVNQTEVIYEQGNLLEGLNLILDQGKLVFQVWSTPQSDFQKRVMRKIVTANVERNQFYHIVAAVNSDQRQLELFVDGQKQSSVGIESEVQLDSKGIGFGISVGETRGSQGGRAIQESSFSGLIAEFEIHSGTIDESEVSELYQKKKSEFTPL